MNKSDVRHTAALRVLAVLEKAGYATRFAGGCVRDRLLGRVPHDYDLATSAPPERVIEILSAAKIKTVPTGLDHGTVTAVAKHGPVEITTLRQDKETDGRHAIVEYSDSFEADAARRDFTINAMFEDSHGAIHDYFGGRKHLVEKRLLFVGDPTTRICEDYLRILRLFRFWGQLGFLPDSSTLTAVTQQAAGLKRISQERKTSELWKLLCAPYVKQPLQAMLDSGIMNYIFAGFPVSLPTDTVFSNLRNVSPQMRPVGFLLWLTGAPIDEQVDLNAIESLADELKLSNADKKVLSGWLSSWRALARLSSTPADHMDWIDRTLGANNSESLQDFLTTFSEALPERSRSLLTEIKKTEDTLGHLRRKPLPLSGADIQRVLQVGPGPDVGRALGRLKKAFRDGEWHTFEDGERWLQIHRDLFVSSS